MPELGQSKNQQAVGCAFIAHHPTSTIGTTDRARPLAQGRARPGLSVAIGAKTVWLRVSNRPQDARGLGSGPGRRRPVGCAFIAHPSPSPQSATHRASPRVRACTASEPLGRRLSPTGPWASRNGPRHPIPGAPAFARSLATASSSSSSISPSRLTCAMRICANVASTRLIRG